MKTLELTFNMKNGMEIEATKKGIKEDVIKELKDSRFLGVEVFGDVVINLEEVLAVKIVEIKKMSTLEAIENAKSILDGLE